MADKILDGEARKRIGRMGETRAREGERGGR